MPRLRTQARRDRTPVAGQMMPAHTNRIRLGCFKRSFLRAIRLQLWKDQRAEIFFGLFEEFGRQSVQTFGISAMPIYILQAPVIKAGTITAACNENIYIPPRTPASIPVVY